MNRINFHAQWRLELARQIAARLRQFTGIQAMAVGGSVARGYADEYSNLEILLFWETLPPEEVGRAVVSALGADFLKPYDHLAQEDNLLIHGFQVDLWHNTVSAEDQVIEDVLERSDIDLGNSSLKSIQTLC